MRMSDFRPQIPLQISQVSLRRVFVSCGDQGPGVSKPSTDAGRSMPRVLRANTVMLMAAIGFCGCSGAQVKQRPDGTYAIQCSDHKSCLDRADRLCGAQGYVVVGGQSNKKLYGVPGNEKFIGKDELFIRCNKDRPLDMPHPEAGNWRLEHRASEGNSSPSGSSADRAAATGTAPLRVCRPGETQRCIGKAACVGGQSCLADGSGFGVCDCGDNASSPQIGAAGAPFAPQH